MLQALADKYCDFVVRIMPDWQKEYMATLGAQMRLSARSSKYDGITTALQLASTFNPFSRILNTRSVGIAPGAWSAYHFCRVIDDIADGDAELPAQYNHFGELSSDMKNAMQLQKYPESDLGLLLRGTVRDMLEFHAYDVRPDMHDFLDAMLVEYERRVNRTINTREELACLYKNSFHAVQDIALICFGSSIRSVDIPELAQLQGRMYAVRDVWDEMSRGIIFVPADVLPDFANIDSARPCIEDWISGERSVGRELIEELMEKRMDLPAKVIVGFLVKGIEKYLSSH